MYGAHRRGPAVAKAREALRLTPRRCRVEVSGNIIKNVKSVTVPNTGGMKGLEGSAAAGIAAGRADLDLEVLSQAQGRQDSGRRQTDCSVLGVEATIESVGRLARRGMRQTDQETLDIMVGR